MIGVRSLGETRISDANFLVARGAFDLQDLKVILGKDIFLNDFKPLLSSYTQEFVDVDSFFDDFTQLVSFNTFDDKTHKDILERLTEHLKDSDQDLFKEKIERAFDETLRIEREESTFVNFFVENGSQKSSQDHSQEDSESPLPVESPVIDQKYLLIENEVTPENRNDE